MPVKQLFAHLLDSESSEMSDVGDRSPVKHVWQSEVQVAVKILRFLPCLLGISPGDTILNARGSVLIVSLALPLILIASSRDQTKVSVTAEGCLVSELSFLCTGPWPVIGGREVGGAQAGDHRCSLLSSQSGGVQPTLQPAGYRQHY